MPRRHNNASPIRYQTTRQKSLRNKYRKGKKRSAYSRMAKGAHAERYSRPYLTGEYRQWKDKYGKAIHGTSDA